MRRCCAFKWDANALHITGTELAQTLDAGSTPRIQFDSASGTRPDEMESTLTVMPYMMMPGDDKIVAEVGVRYPVPSTASSPTPASFRKAHR